MRGSAAKERRLWPALVAATALLLTAPQALASRTASARPDLLASPALEQPAAAEALVTAYVPRGFELRLESDSHPRQLALFPDLTPPPASAAGEKLASGVASWEPRPNLQRSQVFVAETWWVREHLGPVDSPNLYQAFGLDPQNNTDPLGLAEFLKPTTTSVDATYTTCIKSRPQGDVSVPCVDIPGGKVTVEGFTAATDTPDYLRALHRVGVSDEDASAMVARNAPDSAPIAGTALGAAAQGATQAGTVAKPAFHLTMAFVSATGPSILAASRAMPAAYLSGLGQTGARLFEFANYDNIVSSGMKNQWKPGAPSRGSPAHLTAGRAWENAELASLGKPKNTTVWRPSQADIESSAFKVIVGPAKYTSGGRPVGTIVDIVETGGSIEIKGGTKMLESSYQLRLQTYRALQLRSPLTIRTTRPINPEFSAWLERWGVAVENPALPGSLP